ncbi:methylenetetrahydrofolate reductase [NAD(P)H] [Gilvimarinus polysaccharolyticus]|uniref:methylenetetrahydrofolate reductase [NAD(P)H] n=1 Tax=Gilvimarinus polysaccharolyticus TaxID=863921 RepID=UPI000673C41D|nr:methylenetetrahydrofolate reductase [NAD(P)H] [Gilvimarinus polysaccharolyticus]
MSDEALRLSFEFFPPKTDEGRLKLAGVRDTLAEFDPDFFSVTYGAGGSTRDNTKNLVKQFNAYDAKAAPHLSFGGDDEATIKALLEEYRLAGVERIVALRGDMPSGVGGSYQLVYANELVAFIRQHFGDAFALEVAAYPEVHPQAKSYDDDVRFLKGKFDAGANSAITQYFYNPDAYFYFMDQCAKVGIDKPIYPGIMPIINFRNLMRFSDSCGADIPRWLRKRLESFEHDAEALRDFGEELVTELCETLLENGAPGLHFYTMNQAEPVARIVKNLGWGE